MNGRAAIENIINSKPELLGLLFARGYLLTNARTDFAEYPFYGRWKEIRVGSYSIAASELTNIFVNESEHETVILIGHAYNPFDGEYREDELLKKYSNFGTEKERIAYFNQWTGIFTLIIIKDSEIIVYGDCAGMQPAYYGAIGTSLYISSHAQLIGDICGLIESEYVADMKKYRYWGMYGLFIAGDRSQFDDVFRLVPNTFIRYGTDTHEFRVTRFYPETDIANVQDEREYSETINEIAGLMHENMRLISLKWKRPYISMTGGMDSKTTVACTNGLYDKFGYYSYISMHGDRPDAEAAEKIAAAIGVTHKTYLVSENDGDFINAAEVKTILEHNFGNIGEIKGNDVRKCCYFLNNDDFDVEVKSWVSEIGRANYYKKFGMKNMPKRLSPRQMTTMYKFFAYNRRQACRTDEIFKEYIEKTAFQSIYNLDASDMYLWEFRYGAWGGLAVMSEHRASHELTIPYNNRRLIEMFLTLPLEKRIDDVPHYDVIKTANETIDSLGITVTNYNETRLRMYCEKVYYLINTILPY